MNDITARADALGNPASTPSDESGPQILRRLGLDAEKWCVEMVKVGAVVADPAPGGLFHGWMCNAIMSAGDQGYAQRCRETEIEIKWLRRALADAAGRFGLALSAGVDWLTTTDGQHMVSMAVGLAETQAALDHKAEGSPTSSPDGEAGGTTNSGGNNT